MAASSGKKFVVYGIVVMSLLAHIPLLQRAVRLARPGRDRISQYAERFNVLRNAVPPHTLVGYLTDLPPDSLSTDPVAVEHFYLAQYALAPALLKPGADAEFVVGNFSHPGLPKEYTHLHVVKDFGDGLMLLHGSRQ